MRNGFDNVVTTIRGLTQSAGLNLIKHGINVNAISPGVVDGEHWDGVDAFFAKYENKNDIKYIIDNAPSKSALNRTKKLLTPWFEKKNWHRADEIVKWAKDLFLEKDSTYNIHYFDQITLFPNNTVCYQEGDLDYINFTIDSY